MSIYGIGNSGINRTQLPVGNNTRDVRQPAHRSPSSMPSSIPSPAAQPQQTPATSRAAAGVPAEPPPGTDPALWSILSGEERAFFAKAGTMGPLTYGRAFTEMKSAQMPVSRGGRLDVKI